MSRIPPRLLDLVPWALGLVLVAVWGPDLWRSPLLQGDLPGHVAVVQSLLVFDYWPLPWGWEPRFFCGAPIGTLYPPLFHWLAASIHQLSPSLFGPDRSVAVLLIAYLWLLPPSLFGAARGLGLRRHEALLAMLGGLLVLALPMRGLGGSFRQTLVAGNAANAFTLPFLLLFLGNLRRALAGHGRYLSTATLLIVILLGHFLLGAAAGLTLVAAAVVRAWRVSSSRPLLRGAGLSLLGLAGAAPFLLPFVVHLGETSPDGLVNAPLPIPLEWTALLALGGLILLVRPGWKRHPLLAPLLLLWVLYGCRAVIFPLLGAPPVRMEYHRFRLLLYLALVPAAVLALRQLPVGRLARRGLSAITVILLVAFLAVQYTSTADASAYRYNAMGPQPVHRGGKIKLQNAAPSRVLLLADPASQNGSWHGVQLRALYDWDYMAGHSGRSGIPSRSGVKGLFVEQSPTSRAIFELERIASGPAARPHWWAIDIAPDRELRAETAEQVRERIRRLGIRSIIARHEVAPVIRHIALEPPRYLGLGFSLYIVGEPWDLAMEDGTPVEPLPVVMPPWALDHGAGIGLRLPHAGRVELPMSFSSDWRIESGKGTLSQTEDGLLRIDGEGDILVLYRPRTEEWAGLMLGALTWVGIAGTAIASRLRRGMS